MRGQAANAAKLSEDAVALSSEMKRMQLVAMLSTFREMNYATMTAKAKASAGFDSKRSADLHGLHTDEAVCMAAFLLRRARAARSNDSRVELTQGRIRPPTELNLVVGSGTHSKDGREKLRPAILSYLNSIKARVVDQGPFIRVML